MVWWRVVVARCSPVLVGNSPETQRTLLQNCLVCAVSAMKLKSVLGNINELIENMTEAGDLFFAQCV